MNKFCRILNIIGCIALLLYFVNVINWALWIVLAPFWISGIYDVIAGIYKAIV